ncbi:MAG: response regulator transcription factor [Sandaracinus sp.]|nr:response regulator transcription factor [Myxococcales bacterium]MCB9621041.1 response regulator transcription factor [Sandaracinus sp.]MCB9630867.1 response regulator transcription factor [Sandaracinus sp.]
MVGEETNERPILVVEDDPNLRAALARILRGEGHDVLEAADGDTALAIARAVGLRMMVVDYSMPGLDGESVLRQVRADLADEAPEAVLLTAGAHEQARAEALGVLGLCKPFQVETLLAALATHRSDETV